MKIWEKQDIRIGQYIIPKKMMNIIVVMTILLGGVLLFAISIYIIGPNITTIANILISLVITIILVPIIYIFNARSINVTLKIFILVYVVIYTGFTMYSLWERRPTNLFRVFLYDPIPIGVDRIEGYDLTLGFDEDIVLHFYSTPETVKQIIESKKFTRYGTGKIEDIAKWPFDKFCNKQKPDEWIVYQQFEEYKYVEWLWVNSSETEVFYKFLNF